MILPKLPFAHANSTMQKINIQFALRRRELKYAMKMSYHLNLTSPINLEWQPLLFSILPLEYASVGAPYERLLLAVGYNDWRDTRLFLLADDGESETVQQASVQQRPLRRHKSLPLPDLGLRLVRKRKNSGIIVGN